MLSILILIVFISGPKVIESCLTAFVIYFVVIDPVGSATVFLSVTYYFTKAERYKVALEAKTKNVKSIYN